MAGGAGNISLINSIRGNYVNTSWTERLQGDRLFNPDGGQLCIIPSGRDNFGRAVPNNTYHPTKTPGCNSALERVTIESDLRPNFSQYINLNTAGYTDSKYQTVGEQFRRGRDRFIEKTQEGVTGGGFGLDSSLRASLIGGETKQHYQEALRGGFASRAQSKANSIKRSPAGL